MIFQEYKIIPDVVTGNTVLVLATQDEIREVEKQLNIKFESQYLEYVQTFGQGVLGGSFIRIYLPSKIQNDLISWRKRVDEYWFWDKEENQINKQQVLNSIIVGDTLNGDELIYLQEEYYLLSRNSDDIYKLGSKLKDSLEWICSSGVLTEAFSERNFEPFGN